MKEFDPQQAPGGVKPAASRAIPSRRLRRMLIAGAGRVAEQQEVINRLNVFPAPDGDTGSNMSKTLAGMRKALESLPEDAGCRETLKSAAKGALLAARGNSGVIMSQILKGWAEAAPEGPDLSARGLAEVLANGSEMAYQSVIKPVEGTILTVTKYSGQAAMARASEDEENAEAALSAALEQARLALARTPQMLDALAEAGVVDSGGQGYVCFLEGMREGLQGEIETAAARGAGAAAPEDVLAPAEIDLPFIYCTEATIRADEGAISKISHTLGDVGDSLLLVGDEDVVKAHVHINDPGPILSKLLGFGELMEVKVDNMRLQSRDRAMRHLAETRREEKPAAPFGFVAVCSGSGIADIFQSLGVLKTVEGGQTMNPSTEELLAAIESCPAERVGLLPNNRNILLTAQEAAKLAGKETFVVPTTNAFEGFSALLAWAPGLGVEQNLSRTAAAADKICAADISPAVKNARADGVDVREGDFLAIVQNKVVASEESLDAALKAALESMISQNPEPGLATLLWGKTLTLEEADHIANVAKEYLNGIEVEVHYGGQPERLLSICFE